MEALQGKIEIHTDGGCSGNPGIGGWAFVLSVDGNEITKSGGEELTTNNRMELTALIEALSLVAADENLRQRQIDVHTDSQYANNGISTWIENWKQNGWKSANKKPVKNQDLWMRLDALNGSLRVEWHWLKGHAGDRRNELADSLCGKEIAKIAASLNAKL